MQSQNQPTKNTKPLAGLTINAFRDASTFIRASVNICGFANKLACIPTHLHKLVHQQWPRWLHATCTTDAWFLFIVQILKFEEKVSLVKRHDDAMDSFGLLYAWSKNFKFNKILSRLLLLTYWVAITWGRGYWREYLDPQDDKWFQWFLMRTMQLRLAHALGVPRVQHGLTTWRDIASNLSAYPLPSTVPNEDQLRTVVHDAPPSVVLLNATGQWGSSRRRAVFILVQPYKGKSVLYHGWDLEKT